MNELDIALERLHLCAFETADGIANCGPMAAAALEGLGHAALTSGLMDVYVPRFPVLRDGVCLRDEEWQAARGDIARAEDWLATFESRCETTPWRELLADTLRDFVEDPKPLPLAPDALLRLAFAVESLERADTPIRRRELAFGLAYAAAKPTGASAAHGENAHDMTSAMLVGRPPRETVEIENRIREVCLTGAAHYLAGRSERAAHAACVVVPSALRVLLPHLPLHIAAAILDAVVLSCTTTIAAPQEPRSSDAPHDAEVERCAQSVIEIRYRAACSIHEHAILMAHACLREDAIGQHPRFRLAAADAALRLSPPGYREWR